MIKKNTIFDFFTHIMVVWGISVLCLCIFCFFFGESAKGLSSIFELGSAGLPAESLLQFLLLSIIITGLRWLFLSDKVIKQLSIVSRSIFMFSGTIIAVSVMAAVFKWFPMNQAKPWVLFLISFLACSLSSICVSVLKEKSQNRKLQEALERMKGEDF